MVPERDLDGREISGKNVKLLKKTRKKTGGEEGEDDDEDDEDEDGEEDGEGGLMRLLQFAFELG